MRLILALLILCSSSGALAETVMLTGGGTISCGKWVSASNDKNEMQMQISIQWVAGFVGSYNWYRAQNERSQINQPDLDTISLWLTTFCGKNPTDSVLQAAAALVQHMGGENAQFKWDK